MTFWMIVLAVLVVALIGGWLYDRRHKIHTGGIHGPQDDDAVGAAKVERYNRTVGGLRGP